MWTRLGATFCAGLAVVAVADAASARVRSGRAPAARTAAAPRAGAPAATLVGYVPAPRRTKAPDVALRPEFSEGEWGPAMREQLSPKDLAGAAVALNEKDELDEVRVKSTLSKMRERQLQDAQPLMTSSLDQPLKEAGPEKVEIPIGLDLSRLGFTINQNAK
jgi:hypothetical protein